MIVQEINMKDNMNKSRVFKVSNSFTSVEVDPRYRRILFLKEDKTVEIIEMNPNNRYIISED